MESTDWPLDLDDTRMVVATLATDPDLPDGDLEEALVTYSYKLEDSPLEAKTVKSVTRAVRSWLGPCLRRDHLGSLVNRGKAADGARARELLVDEIGTDQYGEISNQDVEQAIALLEG